MKRILPATLCAIALASAAPAQNDRELAFPENYKTEFTPYFVGDRLLEDAQTIRLYANDIAVQGAAAGGPLPSGSVLVAELFDARKDAEGEVIETALGRRLHGAPKAVAVMERRTGWDDQYPEELKVGDWEFEVFSFAGKNLGKDTTGCRECHHPHADTDFLYSIEHLKAAAVAE